MQFSYVNNDGAESLTVLTDSGLKAITGDHPHFSQIFNSLREGDFDDIEVLIDPAKPIAAKFEKVSDRVTIRNGHVYFDGDELNNTLTDHIVRAYSEGGEFEPLINFLEKLMQNPNDHSRGHLYRWLDTNDFTIAEDGDIVGYKGVRSDLTSCHSGYGLVRLPEEDDFIEYEHSHLPNNPGYELSMPRSMVTFDPNNGCSFGLHVGTWDYASGFGATTLEVRVDPRDVVSVPTDCSDQKMRVCRYRVVKEVARPYDYAILRDWEISTEDLGL